MNIFEKERIIFINETRFYDVDLNSDAGFLENETLKIFKIGSWVFNSTTWNPLLCEVAAFLQKKFTMNKSDFYALETPWCGSRIFYPYECKSSKMILENVYMISNYSTMHAYILLKYLLQKYGIEYENCRLIIKKKCINENKEILNEIIIKNKNLFKNYLIYSRNREESNAITHINNADMIFTWARKILKINTESAFSLDDRIEFSSIKSNILSEMKNPKYNFKTSTISKTQETLDFLTEFFTVHFPGYEKSKEWEEIKNPKKVILEDENDENILDMLNNSNIVFDGLLKYIQEEDIEKIINYVNNLNNGRKFTAINIAENVLHVKQHSMQNELMYLEIESILEDFSRNGFIEIEKIDQNKIGIWKK